jgi:acetyl esterase/lipase
MISRDIAYGPGERHVGDVFLPESAAGHPVLLIHGGGWNAMSKEALESMAVVLQKAGRPVFSINYRLIRHAPWPACLEDCLGAANRLLEGGLAAQGMPGGEKLVVMGVSAGGHLALMTGLRIPAEKVERIINLAGPVHVDNVHGTNSPNLFGPRFLEQFFGQAPKPELIAQASPLSHLTLPLPPLLCMHSRGDQLVPPPHTSDIATAWKEAGGEAEVVWFDGRGEYHGFWDSDDFAARNLLPEVADFLAKAVNR